MLRAISVFALAACIALPAVAQNNNQGNQGNRGGNQGGNQGNRGGNQGNQGMSGGRMGGVSVYPAYERKLPDSFYNEGYRLTPREYHRLRAAGFSQREVFFIANASRATGLGTEHFANALYRGMSPRKISYQYGVSPGALGRVLPEWGTQEWANATGESAFRGESLDMWW